MPLAPGLYLVATPIGTADDITLRALRVLADADMLAAEDTRTARRLMEIHGVALTGRQLVPYHDHNGAQARPRLLRALQDGKSVAYVSDAGTPLIADPGYKLAAEAIAADLPVFAAPGASALLAALSVAGLPTDRFFFAGFLPPKSAARRAQLGEFAQIPGTLVFYESPRRLAACLADMAKTLGDRPAAVCRELTKKFEEVRRGPLETLAAAYADEAPPKGEIVIVVGPPFGAEASAETLDKALEAALRDNSLKDAASIVAEATGLPRKQVYARALELKAR
ncbi:16S rRNA (cytidine(1402)-2'-O)-methyltransferase [Oceanibium sediminis]|uniref:16S rRNA (cytidine(1402)-2'-O)-methyltransferase n=1 Tax=Oceanibium sediminis TaxID=2026339 RepID=UPI0018E513B4|nr:16S rRNA (cytidine(1402)-2'-O)-methyltransferase [Oceanibium sediminis]